VQDLDRSLDRGSSYVCWRSFDKDPEWCRYDRLMLEQVCCSAGGWCYKQMQTCLTEDPVRKGQEILYIGQDVVRLAEGSEKLRAVRTCDPRCRGVSWRHCGDWKYLRYGKEPYELQRDRRRDQEIVARIDDLLAQDLGALKPLVLPEVYSTVKESQLARVQLRTGRNSLAWFADRGVANMPTLGQPLVDALRQTAVQAPSLDRLAFPLTAIRYGGVVAVRGVAPGWHRVVSPSIRTQDWLIDFDPLVQIVRAPGQSEAL